jgi:hypothetical protein
MTIAVAIRTSSAVIFAADSKVTTQGVVGFDENRAPVWQTQTYDHAVKVVHDRTETLMSMAAGHANIGNIAATDFISSHSLTIGENVQEQDRNVRALVDSMEATRRSYWESTQVEPDRWPGPTLLLAFPAPDRRTPRIWRVALEGAQPNIEEIMQEPGIRLEGAYNEVFSILYGWHPQVLDGFRRFLEISDARMSEAMVNLGVLRPIDKLNLYAMPVQDAMDLAVFLATVQVQMDRFLPGEPLCGGPIDLLVLQMAPDCKIRSYPGKKLHHPLYNKEGWNP